MPWYHLSEYALSSMLTHLEEPAGDYADVGERCFCVAPTVWQCILATSSEDRGADLFIYEVHTKSPIPANQVHDNVADFEWSGEHRITQQVLDTEGGAIPRRRIGKVRVDKDLVVRLKNLFTGKRKCDAVEEREYLWRVDGEDWLFLWPTCRELDTVLPTSRSN